jgi:hypothetical protein
MGLRQMLPVHTKMISGITCPLKLLAFQPFAFSAFVINMFRLVFSCHSEELNDEESLTMKDNLGV